MRIKVKTAAEINLMKKSARILASLFEELEKMIEPGISTKELDKFAFSYIKKNHSKPSFKGIPGSKSKYPASICASVNEELIHGIPSSKRILKEGDIISIDAGVYYRGYHSDSARTFAVGEVSSEARALIDAAEASFYAGFEKLKAGNKVGDVGAAVQSAAEGAGFSVVREFTGHGIGSELHEPPQLKNYGKPGQGQSLPANCVIALEPMINAGTHKVNILEDGWTVVTADGSLCAHYEHSVLVTEEGGVILTLNG